MASYYADSDERARLIAGFRALADFLQDHPDVPAPRWADAMVFPDGTDEERRAEIERIAARTGATVTDRTKERGYYTASRDFGPVQYKAAAIPVCALPHRTTGETGT